MTMTNDEIRKINLQLLIDEIGKKSALAKIADTDPAYISQILSKKKPRNIGDDLARKLETGCKKPRGWMDAYHGTQPQNRYTISEPNPTHPGEEYLPIKMGSFHLQAGAATGFTIDFLDENNPPIFFRADWIQTHGYRAQSLIACTIKGDSMEPRLYHDDIVVINLDDTKPKDGAVFAINYEGELLIKRLIRTEGQWYLQSDNPDKTRYPNKLCAGDYCLLLGRVIHRQSSEI